MAVFPVVIARNTNCYTLCYHPLNLIECVATASGPDPEMLLPGGGGGGGGGALKAEVLNRKVKAARGGEYERGVDPPLIRGAGNFRKIYVSENAFQAILKPTFPYSITSILSKVRHSNTLLFQLFISLSSSWCFGKVVLFYCGTPLAYQITF